MSDPKGSRRELGAAMRAVRDHLGITQAAVAARMGGYSRGYVSHFESGREVPSRIVWSEWLAAIEAAKQTKQRSGEWTATLAELLRQAQACHGRALADAEALRTRRARDASSVFGGVSADGWRDDAPSGTAKRQPTTVELQRLSAGGRGAAADDEDDLTMDRRRLFTALGLVTLGPALERVEATSGHSGVDAELIGSIAALTDGYERTGDRIHPTVLRPSLEAHVHSIERLLHEGSMLPGQRLALLEQLAVASARTFVLHYFDLDDPVAGRAWIVRGLKAAEASGSPAASVRCLIGIAHQLVYQRRPAESVQLLDHAQHLASRSLTPNVRAWVLTIKAEAYAALGQRTQTRQLLAAAASNQQHHRGKEEPVWVWHLDQHRLLGYEGAVYARLGLPKEARAALDAALAEGGCSRKQRFLYPADLAVAYALDGQLDGACAHAEQALEAAATLGHRGSVHERMTRLRPLLAPWNDDPRVKRLDELVAAAG